MNAATEAGRAGPAGTAGHGDDAERTWTVLCARRRYEVAEVKARAGEESAACEAALEGLDTREDAWDEWELAKGIGSTFVDSLKDEDGTRREVPARHRERGPGGDDGGAAEAVTVVIKGGLVQKVRMPRALAGIELRVEDEDTESTDAEEICEGPGGRRYTVARWHTEEITLTDDPEGHS